MGEASLVAVTVVGNDRPGIVAGVTRVLYEAGCNLLDASSTILRGHFSMMLIVSVPQERTAQDLEAQLHGVEERLGLSITVRSVQEAGSEISPSTHMVSVYGADQPGIVFKVAELLAESDVNITALSSRVIGSDDQPVYALMLEVAAESDVAAEVEALRDQLDVDVTVHAIDSAVL
jgi:glycine cleavage system transcriptional repressor